ncbi:hypothetical protein chiPu_0006316 [Chiloscyllium punctatum]|uniref:Uncharacterized protein n=1 Tax=Chiloscyllium punctatum TaxID=137246 RepID=A0A401SC03_CHIPU|nr:hypothetical protein [Chiloscyllium punctatum]
MIDKGISRYSESFHLDHVTQAGVVDFGCGQRAGLGLLPGLWTIRAALTPRFQLRVTDLNVQKVFKLRYSEISAEEVDDLSHVGKTPEHRKY